MAANEAAFAGLRLGALERHPKVGGGGVRV
jgi:hypothetical protein